MGNLRGALALALFVLACGPKGTTTKPQDKSTALAGDKNDSPAYWNYLARADPQLSQVAGASQAPRPR